MDFAAPFPRWPLLAFRPAVPLVGEGEEGFVRLHYPRQAVALGVLADGVQDLMPPYECGAVRYPAALGAFVQAQPLGHAVQVLHPYGQPFACAAEHGILRDGEGFPAILADEFLGAAPAPPIAQDMRPPAYRTYPTIGKAMLGQVCFEVQCVHLAANKHALKLGPFCPEALAYQPHDAFR